MPVSVAKIVGDLDQVFCPFTGRAVHSDHGVDALPTLLFVYYGNAGEYGYVSDALVRMLTDLNIKCSSDDIPVTPEELAQKLNSDRAFILELDAGWNGVNSYGFIVSSESQD